MKISNANLNYETKQNANSCRHCIVNTFLLQVMGQKTILLFPHSADLHPYPNIHRSYSYSQVRLEVDHADSDSYPGLIHLSPLEVITINYYIKQELLQASRFCVKYISIHI